MKFSLKPTLLISLGVIFALTLYFARGNLRQDWDDLVETFTIHIDNFFATLSPERSRFVSKLAKEEELKSSIGEPFISFSYSEWEKFWDVLYSVHPLDYSDNRRLPPRARQYNYAEMEAKLKKLYPAPFSYFQGEHWHEFWKIVFEKKSGR